MFRDRRATCFQIVNATVITPDRVVADGCLQVEEGRIVRIQEGPFRGSGQVIDAERALLLPGWVDIHSDANEKAIQPRPRATFPVAMALQELDKTLAACGVTTIFHCVAFSNGQKGLRATREAQSLMQSIAKSRDHLLCSTRIHLRYDVTLTEALPIITRLINDGAVDLFSFMDHTPGQGQFATYQAFQDYLGRHHHYTEDEIRAVVDKRIADRRNVDEEALHNLAQRCRLRGTPMASHDDDTAHKVARMHAMGVAISEFPVTLEAAQAAKALGLQVAMGAPNLLMGKSTNNNLTAMDVAGAGLLDIVCSDYAPMTLLHAALTLSRAGFMSLPESVACFSLNPARAAGIDQDTGSLTDGKRADMILVDMDGPVPRVLQTFVGGRQVYAAY
jgi:alpha-D-ribose 1-methylphosphonate 5-triphosphate diphosphatase